MLAAPLEEVACRTGSAYTAHRARRAPAILSYDIDFPTKIPAPSGRNAAHRPLAGFEPGFGPDREPLRLGERSANARQWCSPAAERRQVPRFNAVARSDGAGPAKFRNVPATRSRPSSTGRLAAAIGRPRPASASPTTDRAPRHRSERPLPRGERLRAAVRESGSRSHGRRAGPARSYPAVLVRTKADLALSAGALSVRS